MIQNTNTKKLRIIYKHIDLELNKIDKLLTRINKKKLKIQRTFNGRKIRTGQQELSFDSVKNQQIYQNKQTAFIYEEETHQYQFKDVEIQKKEEEILLDNQSSHLITEYVSRINVSRALKITVQVKSNWIQKYLDHGDCQIAIQRDEQTIEIIGVENGVVSCMTQKNQFIKLAIAQIYKQDPLQVKFINHTKAISLNTCINGRPQLYQLNIESTTRLLIKVDSHEKQMRRILIIKQKEDYGDGYELAWGTYFKQQLIELVTLETGKYKIINLGVTAISIIELYFQSIDCLDIKVAAQQSLKTRQILMKTFMQAYDNCYQRTPRDIYPEYTRNVYMDIGIVVQTYENIYNFQTKFIDEDIKNEDISLLFRQLYSPHQIENRLKASEKITKFYSIQQKPAKLFVPRKLILMGSKVMQTMKVHSVFK